MKKNLFYISFIFLSLIAFSSVNAHTTRVNNGMSVMMHVSPGDAPLSGVVSNLYFYFTTPEKEFSLTNCDCVVEVFKGDKKIFIDPLLYTKLNLVFPKQGIYKLKVIGSPKVQGEFKSFSVEYDLRVERGPKMAWGSWTQAFYFPISIITIILILVFFLYHKRKWYNSLD